MFVRYLSASIEVIIGILNTLLNPVVKAFSPFLFILPLLNTII